MAHSLSKGEAPFASHGLYTQPGVLDDNIKAEREKGLHAGWAWMDAADLVAVYCDEGLSDGMKRGIKRAEEKSIRIEYRLTQSERCINCNISDVHAYFPNEGIGEHICRNCGYRKTGTVLDKSV
jgi:hypothetical protein